MSGRGTPPIGAPGAPDRGRPALIGCAARTVRRGGGGRAAERPRRRGGGGGAGRGGGGGDGGGAGGGGGGGGGTMGTGRRGEGLLLRDEAGAVLLAPFGGMARIVSRADSGPSPMSSPSHRCPRQTSHFPRSGT